MIRVSKQFNFESAHALWNYDGKCKNIHGHTYKLFVTIIGKPSEDVSSPKNGMVMDFGDLKKIVKSKIVDIYDHALIISKAAKFNASGIGKQMYERFITTDYQPTCENMVSDFAQIIKKELPKTVNLHSVRLYETETSYAEWYAEDQ
ncbi:MAG: 6-carboxytetrahydropterin synthase [Bacteroidota bacterium]|nr:6-carboxytetrahydropterin synthase [Bacteroidota bacterium]